LYAGVFDYGEHDAVANFQFWQKGAPKYGGESITRRVQKFFFPQNASQRYCLHRIVCYIVCNVDICSIGIIYVHKAYIGLVLYNYSIEINKIYYTKISNYCFSALRIMILTFLYLLPYITQLTGEKKQFLSYLLGEKLSCSNLNKIQ
jgi:hypothetical protein